GNLVDEEITGLSHEHFDREHPDEIEPFGNVPRDHLGAHRRLGGDARGRDRGVEDMADMVILDRRIGRPGAVAAACDDNRDLTPEIDKALEDADFTAHPPPSLL